MKTWVKKKTQASGDLTECQSGVAQLHWRQSCVVRPVFGTLETNKIALNLNHFDLIVDGNLHFMASGFDAPLKESVMKILLALILVVFSVGCERARMSKAGKAPEQASVQNKDAKPRNTEQESDHASADTGAAPVTQGADNSSNTAATTTATPAATPGEQLNPVKIPETNILEVQPDDRVATFNAMDADSIPTCQGDACDNPVITDDGKYPTRQKLRFTPRTHKLDMIFLLDTSASMRDEHQAVAREITKFISELSPDVAYRIGIMLAHGPRGVSKVGSLYSEDGRNLVISSEEIGKMVGKEQTAAEVSRLLTKRLAKLPTDRSDAQGEVGMLNLYTAFSDATKLNELKKHGMLGAESALLIVTVADEQDICFDYEETAKKTGKEYVPTYATERDRVAERGAFDRQDTCRSVVNGRRLQPEDVVRVVKQARNGLPVIFTGIHYLEGQVPERTDEFSKDNEAGRGYLQVIEEGRGIAVDMAKENFAMALSKIGDYSNFHMKYTDTFYIPAKVDLKRLDPNSISVRIRSANGIDHPIAAGNIRIHLDEVKQRVEVIIAYEALQQAYANKWITEGAELLINYGYKN